MNHLTAQMRKWAFAAAILAEVLSGVAIWGMLHRVDQWTTSEGHFSEVSDWILFGLATSLVGLVFGVLAVVLIPTWKKVVLLIPGLILFLVWLGFGGTV